MGISFSQYILNLKIDKAKNLKVIANFGVGYDNIDWKYATQVGLPVVNTPTQGWRDAEPLS